MGLQGSNIGDVNLASVLVIDQACESGQLLVSLCRNENEWLSPVGWTSQQKITLLDCRSIGEKTEVEIPAEFALSLNQGDKLVLKCSELDLTQSITWEASSFENRSIEENKPSAASLTSGLFARFKGVKNEPTLEIKSEAQKRADDAERAAENYKAKMEAATAAKEEAQRKALEAAREAEAALKMEAERIAEMERAAKAFEEAERLKQDELRRVEEERKVEEARIAEEKRRIEEARKREAEAKIAAERKAALERFENALDISQNEETRLSERLNLLEADAEGFTHRQSDHAVLEAELTEMFERAGARVEKSQQAHEKIASKLEQYSLKLSNLQSKVENLDVDHSSLTTQLEQTEADYLTAQKEAEMAVARAEEKRKLCESVKADTQDISEQIDALNEDLDAQTRLVNETIVKSEKSQTKLDSAHAELSENTFGIETLNQEKENLFNNLQTNRLEIEATRQAIEDTQARQAAHYKAIAHLEAGGDPATVDDVELESELLSSNYEMSEVLEHTSYEHESNKNETKSVFGRVRRSFLREKDPQLSIDIDDPILDSPLSDEGPQDTISAEDLHVDEDIQEGVSLVLDVDTEDEGIEDSQALDAPVIQDHVQADITSTNRRKTKLWTLGALLGGAAILGGGYFMFQAQQPKVLTVKTSPQQPKLAVNTPVPTVTPPASLETVIEPVTPEIIERSEVLVKDISSAAVTTDLSSLDIPEFQISNLTHTGFALKNAAIQDVAIKETPKAARVETPVKQEAVKKAVVKEQLVKKAAIQKPIVAKTLEPANYPELTTRVQTQLKAIGFYNGPLNGLQTTETREAITVFQSVNNLPQDGKISGNFLTNLKNAEYRHETEQKYTFASQSITPESSQLDSQENFKDITLDFDSVQAVPTQAVTTSPLSAPNISGDISADTYVTPQTPVITQEATAPVITAPETFPVISTPAVLTPAPAPKDVIVEAQITKTPSAEYPRAAAARNYYVDARIVVAYDIDANGAVINASIQSNDHASLRFNKAFEKAAINAVKRQKFTPKTVNGAPVISTGNFKAIVFKAG